MDIHALRFQLSRGVKFLPAAIYCADSLSDLQLVLSTIETILLTRPDLKTSDWMEDPAQSLKIIDACWDEEESQSQRIIKIIKQVPSNHSDLQDFCMAADKVSQLSLSDTYWEVAKFFPDGNSSLTQSEITIALGKALEQC